MRMRRPGCAAGLAACLRIRFKWQDGGFFVEGPLCTFATATGAVCEDDKEEY